MTKVIKDFEALKGLVGQEIGVSDWCQITQEQIDAFAALTHDQQWIHVDPLRARTDSPYQTTIAHGFFTLSLISSLHRQAVEVGHDNGMIINYGLNRVRFPSAVRAGIRVRGRSTLQTMEEKENAWQLAWLITVEIEGETKPALVAEWLVRIYR